MVLATIVDLLGHLGGIEHGGCMLKLPRWFAMLVWIHSPFLFVGSERTVPFALGM